MADKKLLLVEDNPAYFESALKILPQQELTLARNYQEAIRGLSFADEVISDLFYRENETGSSEEIGKRAIERIKYGFVKSYIDGMNAGLVQRGLGPSEILDRCFYVLGLTQKNSADCGQLAGSRILDWLKLAGSQGPEKLEKRIRNHIGIDGEWQRRFEKSLDDELSHLRDYMQESPDNYPLGYLVCEEAEKLGKPAILVTSLRHSDLAAGPIIGSAKKRGWKIVEAQNDNKDSPQYWIRVSNLMKEGEEK